MTSDNKITQNFSDISKLGGLDFIKALLSLEEERFDNNFSRDSVYEEINEDFGIFPRDKTYPVYFAGDVARPENKIIFIGINPGYNERYNNIEQKYLEEKGSFFGYCNIFEYWKKRKLSLRGYYSGIAAFLRKLYGIKEKIDWQWFQENLISLDFIPYHSSDARGVRINNLKKYKERYFSSILKILDYLNPQKAIFVNGFLGFENYFRKEEFQSLVSIEKVYGKVRFGRFNGRFNFIGLPFLTWTAGGHDLLVSSIKQHLVEYI